MIPYGKQSIDGKDIRAVVDVMRSDWLTTGPKVAEFEVAFTQRVGTKYSVAVSSGTAALHCAMYAIGIRPGDEVIVPAMTFVASANCVVYQGGLPVFADIRPDTLLIDHDDVERKITSRTKAIIAVDYAGQPCDYDALRNIANRNGLVLVDDACHALGAKYKNRHVGTLADLSVFSFHPVKHITTGEGGMITTDNDEFAQRMRLFRNHGITTDHHQRETQGSWHYEMVDLGYNYRITDFQCALGLSQLKKIDSWVKRRREIAKQYDRAFANIDEMVPLTVKQDVFHAYHIYVIKFKGNKVDHARADVFEALRDNDIGVNVHYIPVYLHPYYRRRFGTGPGLCPIAEEAYETIMTLPLFPAMREEQCSRVIKTLLKVLKMF
jgi:perosamine synthetase